jgi:hypothetical protein
VRRSMEQPSVKQRADALPTRAARIAGRSLARGPA